MATMKLSLRVKVRKPWWFDLAYRFCVVWAHFTGSLIPLRWVWNYGIEMTFVVED